MSDRKFKIHYRGSLFWLIFWFIFFFPLGFVLLFSDSTFDVGETSVDFQYAGSKFWLGFWVLIFFPVAIALLLLNGFSIKSTPRVEPPNPINPV